MNVSFFNFGKLSLPDEISLNIFSFIPVDDLTLRVSLVCQDLLRLTSDENLWKQRVIQYARNLVWSIRSKTDTSLGRQKTLERFNQIMAEKLNVIETKELTFKSLYSLLHKNELNCIAEAREALAQRQKSLEQDFERLRQSEEIREQEVQRRAETTLRLAEEAQAELLRQRDFEEIILSILTKVFESFMRWIRGR